MKKSQIAKMDIPSQLKVTGEQKEILSYQNNSWDSDHIRSVIREANFNYGTLSATGLFASLGVATGLEVFGVFAIIGGIGAGISLLVTGCVRAVEGTKPINNYRRHMKELSQPVSYNEAGSGIYSYETSYSGYGSKYSDSRGIRIKQRSRRTFLPALFLPTRIFRPQLLNETIWYHPDNDIYRRERVYIKATDVEKTVETFDGHRNVFKKALQNF